MPFAAQRRHQYWSVDVRYVEDHQLGTGKPVYVDLDPGELQPGPPGQRDLAPPGPDRLPDRVAGGGRDPRGAGGPRQRRRRHLQGQAGPGDLRGARASSKAQIDAGQAWQNYIETHFNVMRRMADYHYAQATTWAELQAVHDRFFRDYNHQPHSAHRERDRRAAQSRPRCSAGCRAPGASRPTSIGSSGSGPPARSTRGGSVRFRHWRLYGERGLAGERAAVWVWDETLTIEYAAETLAQYRVTYEADGRRLREVAEPASSRPATPRPSRSCRRWTRSSGTRRSAWRPTGRAARGRHRQRKRGSLRRDTTRLAGVAGPAAPVSACWLASSTAT